jgi:hypothetical protein
MRYSRRPTRCYNTRYVDAGSGPKRTAPCAPLDLEPTIVSKTPKKHRNKKIGVKHLLGRSAFSFCRFRSLVIFMISFHSSGLPEHRLKQNKIS